MALWVHCAGPVHGAAGSSNKIGGADGAADGDDGADQGADDGADGGTPKKRKTLEDFVNAAVQHHLLPSGDCALEDNRKHLPLLSQTHGLILEQHRRIKHESRKSVLASDAGISTMRNVQVKVDELPELRPRSSPLTLSSKGKLRLISPIEILAMKGYTEIGLQFLTPSSRKQVAFETTPVACSIAMLGCCASLAATIPVRKGVAPGAAP